MSASRATAVAHGRAACQAEGHRPDCTPVRFYHNRGPEERAVFANTARGWRPVGHIVERGGVRFFVKQVDSRKHRLHSPPAYALEEATLQELTAARVQVVEVTETDTGRVLRAPLRAFAERGLPVHRGGFARQVALPLGCWTVEDPRQPALLEAG